MARVPRQEVDASMLKLGGMKKALEKRAGSRGKELLAQGVLSEVASGRLRRLLGMTQKRLLNGLHTGNTNLVRRLGVVVRNGGRSAARNGVVTMGPASHLPGRVREHEQLLRRLVLRHELTELSGPRMLPFSGHRRPSVLFPEAKALSWLRSGHPTRKFAVHASRTFDEKGAWRSAHPAHLAFPALPSKRDAFEVALTRERVRTPALRATMDGSVSPYEELQRTKKKFAKK